MALSCYKDSGFRVFGDNAWGADDLGFSKWVRVQFAIGSFSRLFARIMIEFSSSISGELSTEAVNILATKMELPFCR